jgi:inorganic pyrophosphatase
MIPRTLLPEDRGGDGDPLDVIVLGPAVPRGSVVQARLLGMLRALDDGELDHKLIAVPPDSPLGSVATLDELSREFGGITEILQIWFANYKGPGEMELRGYAGRDEAEALLQAAIAAYLEQH